MAESCVEALAIAYEWRRRVEHATSCADELVLARTTSATSRLHELAVGYKTLTVLHSCTDGLEEHCYGYRAKEHSVVRKQTAPAESDSQRFFETMIGRPDSFMDGSEVAMTFYDWIGFYAIQSADINLRCRGFIASLFGAMRRYRLRRAADLFSKPTVSGLGHCACCRKTYVYYITSALAAVMPCRRVLRIAYRYVCEARLADATAALMEHALTSGRWQVCFVFARLSRPEQMLAAFWLQQQAFTPPPSTDVRRTSRCGVLWASIALRNILARRFM